MRSHRPPLPPRRIPLLTRRPNHSTAPARRPHRRPRRKPGLTRLTERRADSAGLRERGAGVSPEGFAAVARGALWALVAIVITGSMVRLTGSGLGCSDWPNCEPGEFVPAADFHGWVEFGNRIVTGLVSLAVIVAVAASLWRRPRRVDLIGWSLALVVGVAFQIGLGAVTVLTHLSPPIVMTHFLASQVLVSAAAVLAQRSSAPSRAAAAGRHAVEELPSEPRGRLLGDRPDELPIAPAGGAVGLAPLIRAHAWAVALLTAAALVTGTVVTGTGPHGGDEHIERLQFALPSVARIHGITVVVLAAVTLALAARVRRAATTTARAGGAGDFRDDTLDDARDGALNDGAAALGALVAALRRRTRIVIAVMAVQAAIGYVQYFTELPVLLVALHVTAATLGTIAVTRLVLAATATQPRLTASPPPPRGSTAESPPAPGGSVGPPTGPPVAIASREFAE